MESGDDTDRTAAREGEAAGAATGAGTSAAAARQPDRREAGAGRGGDTSPAAAGSAATASARDRLNDLLTHCERSAIYHKEREGFLDGCHRLVLFLVLASSSSAVYAITATTGSTPTVAPVLALVPALLGAADMTLAFGQHAREHALLARRFLDLAADCGEDGAERHASEFAARFYRLCAEEPPTYKAVDALAHNHVCWALNAPERRVTVTWLQRKLRHFTRFAGTDFPVVS